MPRRAANKKRPYRRIAPTKRLVTGQTEPTLIERLAHGSTAIGTLAKAIVPIAHAINTESKYLDTAGTSSPTSSTPTIICLNNLAQGTTDNNRIGNSILAQSVDIRLTFQYNVTAGFNNIRYMIIVDKMQAGTPLTLAQLLENTTYFMSPLNKDNSDRFVVVKDKIVNVSDVKDKFTETKIFKRLNFHIRFSGPTTADVGPNSVYLVAFTNSTVNAPVMNYYTRIHFTDN